MQQAHLGNFVIETEDIVEDTIRATETMPPDKALEVLKSLLREGTPKHIPKEVVEELVEVEVEHLSEKDVVQMTADLLSKSAKPKPDLSEDLESQRYNDPLSNTGFVTQTQMNDHYKLLLSRIQTQMSTIGGGGEVNLRMLDDVDRSTIADGLCLKYNATNKKFEFALTAAKTYYSTRNDNNTPIQHSTPQIIPDMTLSPTAGTYVVNYNSKFTVVDTASITEDAETDLIALYADLSTRAATGAETTRAATDIYANETLGPGVYIHTGAVTINGILTLDGGGDSTAEFIIRTAGALTTGTNAEIVLTNGATSSNVWFVAAGAPSTGANSTVRGNFLANHAAPSMGASTNFEGRMFSVVGAIAIGDTCIITAPTGTRTTSLGSTLIFFNLFTGNGHITNTGATTVALSIGTNQGSITGFVDGNVAGNIYPGGSGENSRIRVGIYVDGVLIDDSRRTYDHPSSGIDQEYPIVLQTVATLTADQTIDVRGSASFGEMIIGPRMSFIATLTDA